MLPVGKEEEGLYKHRIQGENIRMTLGMDLLKQFPALVALFYTQQETMGAHSSGDEALFLLLQSDRYIIAPHAQNGLQLQQRLRLCMCAILNS